MAKRNARSSRRVVGSGLMGMALWGLAACQGAPDGALPDPDAPAKPKPPELMPATPQSQPAISGGTLLVTSNGATVAAADPYRDSVWLVDVAKMALRQRVQLAANTEPGRLVEDQDGNLHVALRRGGQVVKIDPKSGSVVSARAVCAAPRGLAYDSATDNLHVACATGEVVTLKARGGDIERTLNIDSDLRDVVLSGSHLLVSRFRTAELIEIDETGTVLGRTAPVKATGDGLNRDPMGTPQTSSPTTAWRLQAMPGGQVVMLHQRAFDGAINIISGMTGGPGAPGGGGGYSNGPCKGSSIVTPGISLFSGRTTGNGAMLSMMAMAVDIAVSKDGSQLSVVSLASGLVPSNPGVFTFPVTQLGPDHHCQFPAQLPDSNFKGVELTAVAYGPDNMRWVQSNNPAMVIMAPDGASPLLIRLPDAEERSDSGHQLFHQPTQGLIACASCHAEAGDDSHVWSFTPIGPRRTQNLRGGVLATAPFHWDGDQTDMTMLMNNVFVQRMGGQMQTPAAITGIGSWLDGQSVLPKAAPHDPQAVLRGKALFNDAKVACASCHSGEHLTSNQSVDVGTGKAFQVPSLIGVSTRAPYMHNGCAATLRGRFDPACGGGDKHGQTSQLSTAQLDDLIAYLDTL